MASHGTSGFGSKCVLEFQFGTLQIGIGNSCLFRLRPFCTPAGSRTPVTKYSGCPRYRFFDAELARSPHAQIPFPSLFGWASLRAGERNTPCLPAGWITDGLGGYAGRVAKQRSSNLLLLLRGFARAPGMRKVVRIAQVCIAAVGRNVRQAAIQATDPEPRCGPAF